MELLLHHSMGGWEVDGWSSTPKKKRQNVTKRTAFTLVDQRWWHDFVKFFFRLVSPCWSCRCLPDETRRSFKSVSVEDGEKVMSLATAAREMMKILCSRVLALRRRKWVISPVERMSAFHELGTKWEKRGRRGRVSLTQSRFTTCSLQTLFSSFRHCRDQNSRWNEKSGQNKNLAWKEEGKKTKLRN